jgi:hypothetical protein
MRAPVYRHAEASSTVLGLTLPGFLGVLGAAIPAIQLLGPGSSLLAIAALYVALRIASRGKPPMHWQHLVLWHARRRAAGGRFSAAARCQSPQFPFGPYVSRGGQRRRP